MCTCTYIPTKDGYLFATNRDEDPARVGREVLKQGFGLSLWYVKEPHAGGTNLCLSNEGRLVVLLNGAKGGSKVTGPFLKSRGLVVLDSFEYRTINEFYDDYSLKGINEFTMIAFENNRISRLSWDGTKKRIKDENPDEPHIWASPKLYSKHWQERRKVWLQAYLSKHPEPNRSSLFHFQFSGGDGDPENDMVMNRNNQVRTVSISSVEFCRGIWEIHHKNLIMGTVKERTIPCPVY